MMKLESVLIIFRKSVTSQPRNGGGSLGCSTCKPELSSILKPWKLSFLFSLGSFPCQETLLTSGWETWWKYSSFEFDPKSFSTEDFCASSIFTLDGKHSVLEINSTLFPYVCELKSSYKPKLVWKMCGSIWFIYLAVSVNTMLLLWKGYKTSVFKYR